MAPEQLKDNQFANLDSFVAIGTVHGQCRERVADIFSQRVTTSAMVNVNCSVWLGRC